jgi:hypothetical protein
MIDLPIGYVKRQCARRVLEFPSVAGRLAKPLAILVATAAIAVAQQTSADVPQPSATLDSQFFEHDFVNLYAFGNGSYDTALPKVTSAGTGYGGAFGYDVGGGISAGHELKDGTFSFSYRGDYRHYNGSTYSNGTNQTLNLLFSKRLNRQWSVLVQAGGGIVSYGGQVFSESATPGTNVLSNPLSSESRFANAGFTLTYQQTRRLSYTLGGQGFYNNYNYAGAISSVGGTGTASINYRTTARTTIGGSYSRSYFVYTGSSGKTDIDSGFLTLQHTFSARWFGSVSGGVSRARTHGIITEPITILLDQQLVTGYVTGPYSHTSISPSFQGSLTYHNRHSLLSFSGGQGVNAGNGTLLTSKNLYGGTTFSVTHKLTNFSLSGGYSRLSSLANTVSERYSSATFSAAYGFNIVRFLSCNLRYDFIHYDNLYDLNGVNENRFTLGLSFSSKSIPLSLF